MLAMLFVRQLADPDETPAERASRQLLYSRWFSENCVLSAYYRHGEYAPYKAPLSIKANWGGSVRFHFADRTVAVDDDNYLVINGERTYASTADASSGATPAHAISIFFRQGMAEELLSSLLTPVDKALLAGADAPARPVEFPEHLFPHNAAVTPLLRYIALHVDQGFDDELWYEEQLGFLLERMLRSRGPALAATDRLKMVKAATRKEILRRIRCSTDYINTWYMRPLDIGSLARTASLSRYHFIRLFAAVHGVTPFAYLQRKRAAVATRLLLSTRWGQSRIAERVGFGTRSTMFRNLRRQTGEGCRAIRKSRAEAR